MWCRKRSSPWPSIQQFKYDPEKCAFKDVAARDHARQVANQFRKRQGKGRVLEPLAGRDGEFLTRVGPIGDPLNGQVMAQVPDRRHDAPAWRCGLDHRATPAKPPPPTAAPTTAAHRPLAPTTAPPTNVPGIDGFRNTRWAAAEPIDDAPGEHAV